MFDSTQPDREAFAEAIRNEMQVCASILTERGEDYNQGDVFATDYSNGDPMAWWTLLWFKVLRARSSIQKGDRGRVQDSLRDLANYSFLMLADIAVGNCDAFLSAMGREIVGVSLEGDHNLDTVFEEEN